MRGILIAGFVVCFAFWGRVLPLEAQIGCKTFDDCDGVDNDCDGQVDEKDGQPYGNCDDPPGCYDTIPPEGECGPIDWNCDGVVGVGCSCSVWGETRLCGSSVGVCRRGIQQCVAGTWSTCAGETDNATAEMCNAQDDDCDGLVDEGSCMVATYDAAPSVPEFDGGMMEDRNTRGCSAGSSASTSLVWVLPFTLGLCLWRNR